MCQTWPAFWMNIKGALRRAAETSGYAVVGICRSGAAAREAATAGGGDTRKDRRQQGNADQGRGEDTPCLHRAIPPSGSLQRAASSQQGGHLLILYHSCCQVAIDFREIVTLNRAPAKPARMTKLLRGFACQFQHVSIQFGPQTESLCDGSIYQRPHDRNQARLFGVQQDAEGAYYR
jgi:hypothetical protein